MTDFPYRPCCETCGHELSAYDVSLCTPPPPCTACWRMWFFGEDRETAEKNAGCYGSLNAELVEAAGGMAEFG